MITGFVGGYFVAFFNGWLLTVVLMSSIPPIVMAGGMMSLVSSKMSTRGQDAYAKAATIVEQTIGSIRTVLSHPYFEFKHENSTLSRLAIINTSKIFVGCFFYRGETSCGQLQQISYKSL